MRTSEQRARLDYVLAAYDAAVGKYLAYGLRGMTDAEKTVCVVWIVDSEVNNGGFDQYFLNPSGDTYPEVPAALERIAAPRAAALARRAIALFPEGRPALDNAERQKQLSALTDRDEAIFEDLEQAWFNEIEDLEELLATYLRRQNVC